MHIVFCAILIVFFIALDGSADTAKAAETFKDCSACPTMVSLPRGSFLMGTKSEQPDAKAPKGEGAGADAAKSEGEDSELSDGGSDEGPQHKVEFRKPFAIGQYAVTRGEFAAFVKETGYRPEDCFTFSSEDVPHIVIPHGLNWRNPGFAQTDRDPVVCVSYDDAKKYAAWLSKKTGKRYRLPSEAEWEYAARAGTTTPRYWVGDNADVCRHANVLDRAAAQTFGTDKDHKDAFIPCLDGHVYTAPSGSYPPNPFGLYDMLGNVWQWVEDCYIGSYKNAPADGTAVKLDGDNDSDGKSSTDGDTDQCTTRVLRGGSWASVMEQARSAYRHGDSSRNVFYGFRVARPL